MRTSEVIEGSGDTSTRHGISRLLIAAAVTSLLAGCSPDDNGGIELVQSALGVSGFPQGLTCGIAYRNGSNIVVNGACNSMPTMLGAAASGFHIANDGDFGLPAGTGFKHQAYNGDANVNSSNSNQLFLPKGAACGFKHTCNSNGETCLGFNPGANSCPPGWLPKTANDANAPSGCNFAWCEYQDPNNLCTGESCYLSGIPKGTACGITDFDKNNGQCLGVSTGQSTNGVANCAGSPTNDFWASNFFDAGRSSGHGVGFCEGLGRVDYHGGLVMGQFTIYPIFYGSSWTGPAKTLWQNYLNGVAGYISGTGAPAGKSPFLRQYGIISATVATPVTLATMKTKPNDGDVRSYIQSLVNAGTLPAWAPNRLFMLLPESDFSPDNCTLSGHTSACDFKVWWGYHRAVSSTGFYAVTFSGNSFTTVLASHEIFEAATDPAWNAGVAAWNFDAPGNARTEICDFCAGSGGTFIGNAVVMQQCFDNKLSGICNTTGYLNNPAASTACGRLFASGGQGLVAGGPQSDLLSCDGRFHLAMQTDGNLVLYQTSGPALWATGTNPGPAVTAIMQQDGNFVLNRGWGYYTPEVVFNTATNPTGTHLYVQNDGNLVVYSNSTALWASNTCCH